MDLHSESPFWLIKNGLLRCYPPLLEDIECEVLVVGGGITGALVSHALVAEGMDVVLIDRREIAQGSTSASTALLQYEIDTHLVELAKLRGEAAAVRAYQLCLQAIDQLENLVADLADHCGFARCSSLYVASKSRDVKPLQQEFEIRKQYGFPVEWCVKEQFNERFGFDAPGAIYSRVGATVDPFQLTHRLLEHCQKHGLRVFDRTTASSWKKEANCMEVVTGRGTRIRTGLMVFACGYEAQSYLREHIVSLKNTYAFVTGPDQPHCWNDAGMVWESARPYLYMRRTVDGRIIVGGEDDLFRSFSHRDSRVENKTQRLVQRVNSMFPKATIESEYSWSGTFGETVDGLGYIGPSPEIPLCHFALGFGGNGITFSVAAADILRDLILGKENSDADIFRFGR